MTKNDYITRAQKTAMALAKYLDKMEYNNQERPYNKNTSFRKAVAKLNLENHRRLKIETNGATRNVIITSDYVIKIDKTESSRFGTSKDEYRAYKKLVDAGKDYLVAPITPFSYNNYTFYIMPRCTGIGKYGDTDFPDEDYKIISNYFDDTHSYNIGKFHGRLVLIDYAMNYL